jgi:hypothetical protein
VSGASERGGGWRLKLTIIHGDESYDGVDLAARIVAEGKRLLKYGDFSKPALMQANYSMHNEGR